MEKNKSKRVRCSDEKFLQALFSSSTYAEVAEKTGQKVASTIARYSRVKKALSERGVEVPEMQRKKPEKTVDNIESMVSVVHRLKSFSVD